MTAIEDIRPPVPVTCAHRPLIGGLVAPYVNATLADGGVDFRSPHNARYEECWKHSKCQTCGGYLGAKSVLFGGPNQLRDRHFGEPPLCLPCAAYASRACPMVAGRMERYAIHATVSEGKRGHVCPDGCGCPGWQPTDPSVPRHAGDPAHPWYAVYVPTGSWQLTGKQVTGPCNDRKCRQEHVRLVLNGAILLARPLTVRLVSAPGQGRVWRTLTGAEVANLMPEPESVS